MNSFALVCAQLSAATHRERIAAANAAAAQADAPDVINGTQQDDAMQGFGGNDGLAGRNGADRADGGACRYIGASVVECQSLVIRNADPCAENDIDWSAAA